MKIGLSQNTQEYVKDLVEYKEGKTVWENEDERLVGPFDALLLKGQGLKLFESPDGPEKATQELETVAGILKDTRKTLFPVLLRYWNNVPTSDKESGAILVTMPHGKPLSEVLETADWKQKYTEETKKDIYTEQVSPQDFWADEKTGELILLTFKHVKPEFLK